MRQTNLLRRRPAPALNWLLFKDAWCPAAFNMAMDEALLEAMPRLQKPVLRFYGWKEPAASFGYFQKFSEIENATHLRPLIRRPTGGGLVPHDADWTYSLTFPTNHEWYSVSAIESYRRVHEWIQSAFAKLKIETELATCCKKAESRNLKAEIPGACFAGYEKFDLLWRGKKIAGAAQRRNKLGLLIQGSVQPPLVSLKRTDWESAMCEVASEQFQSEWENVSADERLLARVADLVLLKYSSAAYNQKR